MSDIPAEAVQAAAQAIERALMSGADFAMAVDSDEQLAQVALEAAAPLLAAQVRREVAEELRTQGERERERIRQAIGLPEGEDPARVSMALHNAITGWEMAAHFVEGQPKRGRLIIHNEPARQIGDAEEGLVVVSAEDLAHTMRAAHLGERLKPLVYSRMCDALGVRQIERSTDG